MARIAFMGTPEFAVPILRALAQQHILAGVVTQPDRPAGRGRRPAESPVKQFARRAGIPVIQPARLREPQAQAQIEQWGPEVVVVAAFGQILRPALLNLPPRGCLNVHASLLPRLRGAAPIPAAISAGDSETGVTIMRMDEGLDTGPILAQRPEPIRPDDTTAALTPRLAQAGAELLLAVLPDYLAGRLQPEPQDETRATYAPQLSKSDGHLDFTRPAEELERRVRALQPWPIAFANWEGRPLRIWRAQVDRAIGGQPGTVTDSPAGPAVACAAGSLRLVVVQPPGKRPMPAADFARGARTFIGATLT